MLPAMLMQVNSVNPGSKGLGLLCHAAHPVKSLRGRGVPTRQVLQQHDHVSNMPQSTHPEHRPVDPRSPPPPSHHTHHIMSLGQRAWGIGCCQCISMHLTHTHRRVAASQSPTGSMHRQAAAAVTGNNTTHSNTAANMRSETLHYCTKKRGHPLCVDNMLYVYSMPTGHM